MVEKITGFLKLKGWTGVEEVYTFVIVGTILGLSLLYYFLVYQKEYKPSRFTEVQSYIIKIIALVVVLILILTIKQK